MLKLEACNEILTKSGMPPAATLDPDGPGSTSDVAEAEYWLAKETKKVLSRGWSQNTVESVTVYAPTDRIVVTGTGVLIVGERITESVSGAYGILQAIVTEGSDTVAYIARQGSTAFTGGQTLTGSDSGNTRTGAARTAVTDGKLRVGTDWIEVRQADDEQKELTTSGSVLYDMSNNRFTFSEAVKLRIVFNKDFETLTYKLAMLCTLTAAVSYQREKKSGVKDDSWNRDALVSAKIEAEDEDTTQKRTNIYGTQSAHRMHGRRRPGGWNEGERYA